MNKDEVPDDFLRDKRGFLHIPSEAERKKRMDDFMKTQPPLFDGEKDNIPVPEEDEE